jgi:hypothetical protein
VPKTKSGAYWVEWASTNAKNSTSVDDLDPLFKLKVRAFLKALQDAGATVTIGTTRRSDKRAYLFHWSWRIAVGNAKASAATAKPGVDILWDHGNAEDSRLGAQEMVDGFGLAVPPKSTNPPSLVSHHIRGKAIDMTIRWTGALKVKKHGGGTVDVPFMESVNLNSKLHAVGASYGVLKLKTDAPHWSLDGH